MKNAFMNTGIVILAAGEAKRMGSPKQLLRIEGKTLMRRIAEVCLATQCFPIVVVLGANKEQIKPELAQMPLTIIENPDWKDGMSASLKVGLVGQFLTQKEIEALIFTTADMPYISTNLFDKMIELATQNPDCEIVACRYENQLGVPVLFKRTLFNAILDLTGDEGAKKIVKANLPKTKVVDFPEGKIDLDTIEDYQNFVATFNPN
jgi:molybdenum cofactor cytidylyltransferase